MVLHLGPPVCVPLQYFQAWRSVMIFQSDMSQIFLARCFDTNVKNVMK